MDTSSVPTALLALGSDLDLVTLTMELLGGLALFLFGMEQMADALKLVAGDRMRGILARLTSNRFMGVSTGAFVTAVVQSSSVTTVLVVGFISAGLMSMSQSIGIIMGANIGTTITAQIVAFKVSKFSLAFIAVGFGVVFLSKREQIRNHGRGIMGLGLVFFGMGVMGTAMTPLRTYAPFVEWMARMENPGFGILAGALFTALVQSSSATSGVVIAMASQGLISLPAGIAISFGANIGTCVTALLASLGKPREALRAAVVHVLFNVLGVLVWVAFISHLAEFVTWFSPSKEGLTGTAKLAAETPRQIANAHTLFNIANTFLFLGFVSQFARLVEWMVPDRPLKEAQVVRAKFLNEELLITPAIALDRTRLELLRMGERVQAMMAGILPAILSGTREELEAIRLQDDEVDTLHGLIVTYLGQISRAKLSDAQTQELIELMQAVNALENIGDIIETNLVRNGTERIQGGFAISDATREVLTDFHRLVSGALNEAILAVTQNSSQAAEGVVSLKGRINEMAHSAALHEAQRLVAAEPNRLRAYTIETGVLESLKRIYYFAKRMARTAGQKGELG